jgi:hypothetical protein
MQQMGRTFEVNSSHLYVQFPQIITPPIHSYIKSRFQQICMVSTMQFVAKDNTAMLIEAYVLLTCAWQFCP